MYIQTNRSAKAAFTLVEMIVSLGIFAMVAVVALGALTRIISANQKGQTLQSAMTNLNFSLESMSRELRVGGTFHCEQGTNPSGFGNSGPAPSLHTLGCAINTDSTQTSILAFSSSKTAINSGGAKCHLVYIYRFIKDIQTDPRIHLQKAEQSSCAATIPGNYADFSNAAFDDILSSTQSSSEVVLTDFRLGVGPSDGSTADKLLANAPYPWTYIRLSGYAGKREKDRTYFDIQTTISERTPKQ